MAFERHIIRFLRTLVSRMTLLTKKNLRHKVSQKRHITCSYVTTYEKVQVVFRYFHYWLLFILIV